MHFHDAHLSEAIHLKPSRKRQIVSYQSSKFPIPTLIFTCYNKHRTDAACSNLPAYVRTSTPRSPRHMEGFHSRGQHLCKFIGTKKIFDIKKEFNYHRTGLEHKHCRRFIVLKHRYGRRDVMWKRSILLNCVKLGIGHPCYWQLTAVKKVSADRVITLYCGLRYITHGGDVVFQLSADHQRAQAHFWTVEFSLLSAYGKK